MLEAHSSGVDAILSFNSVTKSYTGANGTVVALDSVSFVLSRGQTCAVVGPSGSGKSTLLCLAAGLDRPSTGQIVLDGHPLHGLSEDNIAAVRAETVGFVFQAFQLLGNLTALENVMMPLEIVGSANRRENRQRALDLLDLVGLANRKNHYPSELSGGEQQRVALARAFAHQPRLLLADEPTGSLDEANAELALSCMLDLNQRFATTLVLVTHDSQLARKMERQIVLRHGALVE